MRRSFISQEISRTCTVLLFCACIIAFGLAAGTASAEGAPGDDPSPLEISGSILSRLGYIGFRDDIPDEAASDWYSLTSSRVGVSRTGDGGRFRAALWSAYDSVTGDWGLSLDEAWAEWTPSPFFSARMGRSPLQYGPCVAFNPAFSFVTRDRFDSRAVKVGLDSLSFEAFPVPLSGNRDSPVSVVMNGAWIFPGAALAPGTANRDLGESSAHARITLYLPEAGPFGSTELGLSGDLRRIGALSPNGVGPWGAGSWLSTDLSGFVIALEGAKRSGDFPAAAAGYECAFCVNKKAGDYLAILEAQYTDAGGKWLGFAQLSRSTEAFDLSLSALVDFEAETCRASLEAVRNLTDFLVVRLEGSWNYNVDYTAGLALEYFF